MRRSLCAALALFVGSPILSTCTTGNDPAQRAREVHAQAPTDRRDFVGDSSIRLPPTWSYMVTRQAAETPGGGSWAFTISPFSFNLGRRCDRETGPLVGSLFERAEVFITGFAYKAEFPRSANIHKQTLGRFHFDDASLAQYEGFCVPTYRIDFELHDYYVSTHVAVHEKAQPATIEAALDALNSIR